MAGCVLRTDAACLTKSANRSKGAAPQAQLESLHRILPSSASSPAAAPSGLQFCACRTLFSRSAYGRCLQPHFRHTDVAPLLSSYTMSLWSVGTALCGTDQNSLKAANDFPPQEQPA